MKLSLPTLILLAAVLAACASGSYRRVAWEPPERPELSQNYSQFLVGRFASLTNDPATAARSYLAAIQSDPGNSDLTERAVFSLLLSGNTETALRVAKRAPTSVLDSASLTRLTAGVEALTAGRTDEALDLLSTGDLGPFNTVIAEGVAAWVQHDLGNGEDALAQLTNITPDDPLVRGLFLSTTGLLQVATYQDEAAISTFSDIGESGVRLAIATEYHARLLAARGQRDEAVDLLADFQRSVGANAALGQLESAIRDGETTSLVRPSTKQGAAYAVYAPAAALAVRSGGDAAGVYFALALALNPELDVARTLWADTLDQANRRDKALSLLEDIDRNSPFYTTARGQMAWVLRREGRNDEAIALAQEALQSQPDRDLKIQLGDLFRSLDRHSEAERIFDEIILEDAATGRQADWRLLFARAGERNELGRWPEAERDLLTALDIRPNQPEVLNYLGYSWVDRGQYLDEAFRMIQRAVSLRPNSGFIVDSLGWAYYRLGQYDEAVRHLERAVELAPGDAVLNDHLGDAYWQVGRRLEAGFQWRRALELNPEPATIPALENKLAHGLVSDLTKVAEQGLVLDAQP